MKGLILAVLCSLHCVAFAQIDCSDKPDGIYGLGCRSYTVCAGGSGSQVDCVTPKVFNINILACDDRANTPPPCGLKHDCTNIPDGRYAELSDNCTSYYTCLNGVFFGHQPCNPGLVFNEKTQNCDYPYNTEIPCGTKEPVGTTEDPHPPVGSTAPPYNKRR